ncbi:TBCC domain-containing protein 1 [Tanacetum coccineum]
MTSSPPPEQPQPPSQPPPSYIHPRREPFEHGLIPLPKLIFTDGSQTLTLIRDKLLQFNHPNNRINSVNLSETLQISNEHARLVIDVIASVLERDEDPVVNAKPEEVDLIGVNVFDLVIFLYIQSYKRLLPRGHKDSAAVADVWPSTSAFDGFLSALTPLQLVRSNSRRSMPSQADEEAHQLSYLQKHLGNIISLLADSVEGEDSLVLSMEKFEHLGFLIYFGEKGSEKTPLSQNAPFFANSDPDMPAAPVPASQVHDWISQNISDALERISERAAAKENGQSSPSDQDVLMTEASPTKTSTSTKGPSFIEGISKQSYVKQAPELKGSYVKVVNCHESVIYVLAPLKYATIYGCSDATIVLGAVGKFVFGEDEALTWGTVASASGVNEPRHYTRRNASASTSRTLYDKSDKDLVDEDDIVDLGITVDTIICTKGKKLTEALAFVASRFRERHVALRSLSPLTTLVLNQGTAVRIEHCERVHVISASKRICIANCRECIFFLGVNQQPLIVGDNHKLQVAPYNTFYPQLEEHMQEVGIEATPNRWGEPVALGLIDPHDSLSHPAGVSDCQAESAARLDPDQFTNFLIPNWLEGQASGSTKDNPFPLPDVYLSCQRRNESNLVEVRQMLREAPLEDSKKKELSSALHVYFKDWASANVPTPGPLKIKFRRSDKAHRASRKEVQTKVATKQSRFKELLACNDGNQEDIDLAKERYKVAKKAAKIAVAHAKDKAYKDLYRKLDSKEGANDIYKIVKARERKRMDIGNVRYIKDEGGQTIVREEDIWKRWGEYFQSLFNESPPIEGRPERRRDVGSSRHQMHYDYYYSRINQGEVRVSLQRMGRNKAVGPDQIPIEAWRCLEDEGVKWLTCLFNKIFLGRKML